MTSAARRRRTVLGVVTLVALATATGPAGAGAQDPAGVCKREGGTLVLAIAGPTELVLTPDVVSVQSQAGSASCSGVITDVRATGTEGRETVDLDFAGREVPVALSLGGGVDYLRLNRVTYDSEDRPAAQIGTGIVTADMGPGNDEASALNAVGQFTVALGEGDDGLLAEASRSLVVDGGPGDDRIDAFGTARGTGPWRVDGGDGRDMLDVQKGPRWSVFGGAGNDSLDTAPGTTASCGPGDDIVLGGGSTDRTCPPQVLSAPGSGRYRKGGDTVRVRVRVDRRARVTLTLATFPPSGSGKRPMVLAPRRTVTVRAGTNDLALPLAPRGRRALRSRSSVRALLSVTGVTEPGQTEGRRNTLGFELQLVRSGG